MKRLICKVPIAAVTLLWVSFTAVFVFPLVSSTTEGPAKLAPEKPRWGDTITVTYDPAVKGAKFLPGDTIYIYYVLTFPEFSKNSWTKMDAKDGTFKCDIRIPEGSGFLHIDFMTMDGRDQNAYLRNMIFRQDGVPAEGAWQGKLWVDSSETGYLDAFKNERKLYPENYSVYRDKWLNDGFFKKDDQKAIVGREIGVLKKPGIKESPGLLRALSCGYLILDDEKASREVLRRMVRIYQEKEDTAWALREYDQQAFSKQFRGEGPEEIKRLKLELLRKNPGSKILRDYILLWISYEKNPPLDIVRTGFKAWIKDEPDNPTPYYTLAIVLLKKNNDLNDAAGLIVKALDRLVAGKLRLFGDVTGSMTERSLPDYYATAAAIHEKLGDYSTALTEIKAAQTLSKQIRPDLFMGEASIWRSLGYFNKAEKTLLEARWHGAKNADGELREIYRQRHQTEEGYDTWLAEKTRKQSPAKPGDKKLAPGFEVKTLEGKTLRLTDLKGKVVVLNFWYIECAPCRVEIPCLNKLVDEFSGQDVVFIGFALDKPEELRSFLKEVAFKYQIVAEASAICSLFGVSAYPTHVIINKQGQIEFLLLGGSPNQDDKLRPLIKNLLH
ncbi:MAG: TlpA disulfide reductase family protein [Candidatus Aminicenantes bacterium]|jgi:peroxiredoxin